MEISTVLGKSSHILPLQRSSQELGATDVLLMRCRTTFNLDDWLSKTPKSILAKSFGLPESVFSSIPSPNPYILNSTTGRPSNQTTIVGGKGELAGDASYVYRTFKHAPEPAPGGGGQWWKIDSTNFPVAKTIASTYVVIEPKGVRELHWHPTVSPQHSHSPPHSSA